MIFSSPVVLVALMGLVCYTQAMKGGEDDNCKKEITAADKRDFDTTLNDVMCEGDCDAECDPNDDGSANGTITFSLDIENQMMTFRVYYVNEDGDDLTLKAEGSAPAPDFFQKYRPIMAMAECKITCNGEPMKLSTPIKACEEVLVINFNVFPRFFPNNFDKGKYRIELEVEASDNNNKSTLIFLVNLV